MLSSEPAGRAEIVGLIPHQGRMCLLDAVRTWDAERIECLTQTHLDPANPLRRNGRLAALHLVEYGAQAMAVHGGLIARAAGASMPDGLLAAVRDLLLEVTHLDDLDAPLHIAAQRLVADATGRMYRFEARAGERLIGQGRLSVITRAG